MEFLNLAQQKDLISGVLLYPLKVNRDSRGILVETLKTTWPDVLGVSRPFTQCYYSMTFSGVARDEEVWHYHPLKQEDRFVVSKGDIIVALYDWRKDSLTNKRLNLFKMGETDGDEGQYLLLIPTNVLHGFCVVSKKSAIILNFPTSLYDKNEEGRISHREIKVKFSDGTSFSWERIRKEFL